MSIIGNLLQMGPGVDPFDDPRLWSPGVASVRTTSGESVNPDSSLALGTYWACLMVLSQDVAKIRRHLYRRVDEQKRTRETGDRRYWMIHDEPNPEISDFTFVETLTHWAAGWGNGYAEIVRDDRGAPVALYPIHPSRVAVKRYRDTGTVYYEVRFDDLDEKRRRTVDGKTVDGIPIQAEDMFHIRGLGGDLAGYSVARLAAETVGHALAVRRFGAAFFGNGTAINLAFSHPGELGENALAHLRSDLSERHGGAANAFRPYILEEGMKLETFGLPPEQAQFLETIQATVPEVCRWFRMPPHMVGHLDNAIKANIEEQTLSYVPNTIMPWTRRWDIECNRKLLFESERRVMYFEHDLKSLLMADARARGDFYKVLRELGAISGNEIRAAENMDSMGELGDVYLAPVNYSTLDRIVNGAPPAEDEPTEPEDDGTDEMEPDDDDTETVSAEQAMKATMRLFVQAADRTLGKLRAHESRKGKADGEYLEKLASEMAENMEPSAEALLELAHGPTGLVARRPEAVRRLAEACRESLLTRDAGEIAEQTQLAVLGLEVVA